MLKKPRTLLVFPPLSSPMSPYISVPALTAFIRSQGYPVEQRDLNIEALDELSKEKNLKLIYQRACARFDRLKNSLSGDPHYDSLAEILFFAPGVIASIEESRRFFQSGKGFYNRKNYLQKSENFYNALKLILGENYPYHIKVFSANELLRKIQDEDLNPFIDFFREKTVPSIIKGKFDIVGISVIFSTQLSAAFTLARLIKQAAPRVHVCMGGSLITYLGDELARNNSLCSICDSFVINEGEHALLELIRRIQAAKPVEGIPNLISCRNKASSRHRAMFAEPMEELPAPDFRGLPLKLYLSPQLVLPLKLSRGCYWGRCAFCRINGMTGGKVFRARSLDKAVQDIRLLTKRYKTRYLFFGDEAISPQTARGISLRILKEKLNVYWQSEIRFEEEFDLKLCRLMFSAGCRAVSFGLESASNRVLSLMHKGTNVARMKKVLRNFKRSGIGTDVQFFSGFPTETRREALATLRFVSNNRDIDTVSYAGQFQLYKETPVFNSPRKYGISKIYPKRKGDLNLNYEYQVASGMSAGELKELAKEFRTKVDQQRPRYFMHPSPNFNIHRLLYAARGKIGNGK